MSIEKDALFFYYNIMVLNKSAATASGPGSNILSQY